ncbi:MAG: HisA/HisF-related TIM barrel protein [bacterium]|nr:HisA/HisF-related TIM barrel protein [bacterium]
MKVLPVIDLLAGKAVHAVRGERQNYQPVNSRLGKQGDVGALSNALATQYGFTSAYVADLAALGGIAPDVNSLNLIRSNIANLWVDAGIQNANELSRLDFGANLILSTESVNSLHEIREAIQSSPTAVFSVDMQQGNVLSGYESWRRQTPNRVINDAVQLGFRRLLLLDLAAVGNNSGPCLLTLIRETRKRFPELEITSGGGVRSLTDLQQLEDAGCDFALVATALHHGPFLADGLPRRYIE